MEYKGYQVGLSYRFSLIRAFRDLEQTTPTEFRQEDRQKGPPLRHCNGGPIFNYRLMAATKAVSVQFLIFAGSMLSPMI